LSSGVGTMEGEDEESAGEAEGEGYGDVSGRYMKSQHKSDVRTIVISDRTRKGEH
jgi:hypothetical protein